MFKELFPFSTPSYIIVLILITVGVELLQLKTEMILHKLHTNPDIRESECDCKPSSCPSLPHSVLSCPILSHSILSTHMHARTHVWESEPLQVLFAQSWHKISARTIVQEESGSWTFTLS